MKTLRIEDLSGACTEQRDLFCDLFGDALEIKSEAQAVKVAEAHFDKFDWTWAAEHLLNAPARAEYDKVCDAAWAECTKALGAALAEHDRACNAARTECTKVCATAFARLWWEQ